MQRGFRNQYEDKERTDALRVSARTNHPQARGATEHRYNNPAGPDYYVPNPKNITPDKVMCKNPYYLIIDSTGRERATYANAGSFTLIADNLSGSQPVQPHPQQQYYMKLQSAVLPYNVLWINAQYLLLRVRIMSNSISRRSPLSNNPVVQDETFMVFMNDTRHIAPIIAGPNLQAPAYINCYSPMKIVGFNPFKSDIEVTWMDRAGNALNFGNPAPPGADDPLLQTSFVIKLKECC